MLNLRHCSCHRSKPLESLQFSQMKFHTLLEENPDEQELYRELVYFESENMFSPSSRKQKQRFLCTRLWVLRYRNVINENCILSARAAAGKTCCSVAHQACVTGRQKQKESFWLTKREFQQDVRLWGRVLLMLGRPVFPRPWHHVVNKVQGFRRICAISFGSHGGWSEVLRGGEISICLSNDKRIQVPVQCTGSKKISLASIRNILESDDFFCSIMRQ